MLAVKTCLGKARFERCSSGVCTQGVAENNRGLFSAKALLSPQNLDKKSLSIHHPQNNASLMGIQHREEEGSGIDREEGIRGWKDMPN